MRCLLFIFFFVFSCLVGNGYAQGLRFYGNESRIAERSSFCVFDERHALPAARYLSISFEYKAQNYESPGYIFYLKDKETDWAYNLTYVYDAEKNTGSFMLAQDGKQIFHTFTVPVREVHRRWIDVSLRLDFEAGEAFVRIDNDSASIRDIGTKGAGIPFVPVLYFGMYQHILETASFCLRNLEVECNGEVRHFPLDESTGSGVHDSEGIVRGYVQNPVWLVNDAYHWKPLYRYYSLSPAGFAFSVGRQMAYVYNRDSLIAYDLYRNVAQGRPYDSPALPVRLGMCFYGERDSCIYAYELNGPDTYVARIEPSSCRWEMLDKGHADLQLHHHGALFDQQSRRILFFGGYGNRSYYNSFISYDLAANRWDTVHFDGPAVAPRFFAGMALASDGKQAYLYGGKGNEAGDQNVGIRYYYDLYRLDLERHRIEKLWEHPAPAENRVPVRDMIPSPDGKWLYLLAYPEYKPQTHLRLYRYSVADGHCEVLGDSIPMTSEEIATNANLYYSARLREFYCVIQEFGKYGDNETRIYALSDPPVSEEAVHRYDRQASLPWWIGMLVALAASGGIVWALVMHIRRHRKPVVDEAGPQRLADGSRRAEAPSEPVLQEADADEEQPVPQPGHNRLCLFGPFYAVDRNGLDISHLFSPKIRHLFLYILVNSVLKDGVLSSDLNVLFWPDKPEEKIKNLKNVNMNHLRKALQDMDGIALTHNSGYYRLELSEECNCDFWRLSVLTDRLTQVPESEEEREEMIRLLSRGKFLDTVRTELFDYAKQQVETFVISFLERQIEAGGVSRLRACRILQKWDPLSETALTHTVAIYRQQGQHDKALQAYALFAKEYQQMMGESYPLRFEDVGTVN